MTPENKVVSLETAKRLKELGFPQDTERWFYVHTDHNGDFHAANLERYKPILNSDCYKGCHLISAPDAQEIGELLPEEAYEMISFGAPHWRDACWYIYWLEKDDHEAFDNEAEARAACWIYLKENKFI